MPEEDIARLQRVQNCFARVVTKAPRFSRSVPILKRLHWLPVKFRIHFKICAITFRTLKENQPAYLTDLLVRPKCPKYLRSTNSNRFVVPRTKGGGPRVVVSTAAFHARVRGSVPGLGGLKETKLFLPHPRVKVSIVGSLRDREVACSASDRQGSNFESCVWRTVSSQSSHHPQEVLLAQFSLYVHKGGLKPDSFHFILFLVQ